MKPALEDQPCAFPGKWPSLPCCHLTFLSAGPWQSEAGSVWVSKATCHCVGKSEGVDAMRRGIRLYIGTALVPQAHPQPDPHGTFNLEAGVIGGLPDAKWYNLCL